MAWVTVPTLEVLPSGQTYTALDGPRVRYRSRAFTAELELDERGFVTHYPGLADRPRVRRGWVRGRRPCRAASRGPTPSKAVGRYLPRLGFSGNEVSCVCGLRW
jgi:hypothetical protein